VALTTLELDAYRAAVGSRPYSAAEKRALFREERLPTVEERNAATLEYAALPPVYRVTDASGHEHHLRISAFLADNPDLCGTYVEGAIRALHVGERYAQDGWTIVRVD
jgi:hypothetical protein